MKFLTIFILILLLAPYTAFAQNDGEHLQTLEQQLQSEKQEQDELAKKLSSAKGGMEQTQNELVRLAASIRANEAAMEDLDKRIDDLSKQESDLTAKLESDYGSISNLILALQRIRRVPPEAVIARPGAPLQTAQSAMLLQGVLPAVNARAKQLSTDLERLANIRQSLADDRKKAADTGEDLKNQSGKLQAMLAKRKALFRSTQSDYAAKQQSVARISKEAENLRDLLQKLQQQDRLAAKKPVGKVVAMPRPGIPGLPISGPILTAFGEKDNIGAISQGVRVKTRSGALVVAPMGGIVKFAGTFRNYGQLVIIEHQGDYHSLVGGLGKISVALGQSIKSGEPLGNMPSGASSDGSVTLYYELRHNGRPVDPATKLKDLRS